MRCEPATKTLYYVREDSWRRLGDPDMNAIRSAGIGEDAACAEHWWRTDSRKMEPWPYSRKNRRMGERQRIKACGCAEIKIQRWTLWGCLAATPRDAARQIMREQCAGKPRERISPNELNLAELEGFEDAPDRGDASRRRRGMEPSQSSEVADSRDGDGSTSTASPRHVPGPLCVGD